MVNIKLHQDKINFSWTPRLSHGSYF
jgi:hypothetical protein